MPIGDEPAGEGPAGEDSPVTEGPVVAVTLPRAIQFDAGTKAFPMDADGRYIDIHPVDQQVALALTILEGSIASDPKMGHRLRKIRSGSSVTAKSEARDAVRIAVKHLLDRGDIQLGELTVEIPNRWSLFVDVPYQNLRLTTNRDRNARVKLL